MAPFLVDLPQQPWSLSLPAEQNRDALVRFWLAAPIDQLEILWAGPIGESTRQLVRQLTAASSFTPAQVASRDAINQRLAQGGLQQPLAPQLILAVFHYSPPGLMRVANAHQQLPAWLAQAYCDLYETPVPAVEPPQPVDSGLPPRPDFGIFPSSLAELVGNRIQLNRILGLSNLYYIDPEDQEILQELAQVRTQLANLILQSPEASLEGLWGSDLGDRYWAMVRSGVQKEILAPQDQALKERVTAALNPSAGGGFGTPGALNAFLVAMLYFEPGSMRVDGAETKLPGWLVPHYQQIFAQALEPAQA